MNRNKGFTLIELLVTIAIISVLTSVVLLSLSSAKEKGIDSAVKSGLNQVRIQADLFYNYRGIYTGICDLASDSTDPKGVNFLVLGSGKSNSIYTPVTVNGVGASTVRCNSSVSGWAAEVPLKNGIDFYCVDYTRQGIVTTTSIGNSYGYCR